MDRPTLPRALTHQMNLIRLFCLTFTSPRLAQPPPLCFSRNRPDLAGNQANQGTEAQSFVSGSALGEPALVHGAVSAAHGSPVAHSPETRPPLSGERKDLTPPAQSMGATSLTSRWETSDLPESVLKTPSQARAPSMRCLYALKESVFSAWCTTHGPEPVLCDILLILSLLQELLEKGRSLSTLKVYEGA